MNEKPQIYFEKSYFSIWVRTIAISAFLLLVISLIKDNIYYNLNIYIIVGGSFLVIILFLILFANLKLWVTPVFIEFAFFPFLLRKKKILKDDIVKISVVKYAPIYQFGGWGVRYNRKKEKLFSTQGNKALLIELKNKSKIYIGIHKQADLLQYLEQFYADEHNQ